MTLIEMRGAGLTYPGPPPVAALKPVELTVSSGDYLTVVGPSGSGKSTLLNVVGLLDRPSTGSYVLDGVATETLTSDQRAALRGQRVGFVFQAFHLMPLRSAVENVELSLLYAGIGRAERRERALAALRSVSLTHRANTSAAVLSGGEKQRVALARALAVRPHVLLCDEPTGNLDTTTAGAILELLDDLNASGSTLIVITHDRAVAGRGRRRLQIVDGVLSETTR
jgi:putative ABC transport system ATP-binding protein